MFKQKILTNKNIEKKNFVELKNVYSKITLIKILNKRKLAVIYLSNTDLHEC
jgi:hypothetical protein